MNLTTFELVSTNNEIVDKVKSIVNLTPSLAGFVQAIRRGNSEQIMCLHSFSCSSLSLRNIIIHLHMVVGHTLYYNPGWIFAQIIISILSKINKIISCIV